MNEYTCMADMTSIVWCDDDWEPNHVNHYTRGEEGRWEYTGEEVGKGYMRAKTDRGDFIIVYADDWEVCPES
jgi:hypothetical protein